MRKPFLNNTQFALMMADGATGHILSTDYQIYTSDEKDVYLIFDNIDLVHQFIKKNQEQNDTIDFSIYNSAYILIEFIKSPKWA